MRPTAFMPELIFDTRESTRVTYRGLEDRLARA